MRTALQSWRVPAAVAVVCLTAAAVLLAQSGATADGVPTFADGIPAATAGTAATAEPPARSTSGPTRSPAALPDLAARLTPPARTGPVAIAVGPHGPTADPGTSGSAPWSAADGDEQSGAAGEDRPTLGRAGHRGPDPVAATDQVDAPDPVSVRIPALGVSSHMIPLGLQPSGQIEVPADPQQVGWWVDGPEPGEPGAAVLLGHVDSWRGPGVFYGLNQLDRDDRVVVDRADGSAVVYRITQAALYGKDEFPADRVFDSGAEGRLLRLVTCGGSFDRLTGSYDANYVVYAEQEAVLPALR